MVVMEKRNWIATLKWNTGRISPCPWIIHLREFSVELGVVGAMLGHFAVSKSKTCVSEVQSGLLSGALWLGLSFTLGNNLLSVFYLSDIQFRFNCQIFLWVYIQLKEGNGHVDW